MVGLNKHLWSKKRQHHTIGKTQHSLLISFLYQLKPIKKVGGLIITIIYFFIVLARVWGWLAIRTFGPPCEQQPGAEMRNQWSARPSVDFATNVIAEVAARGKGINAMESWDYLTLWLRGVEVDPLLDVEVDPLYEVEISTLSPSIDTVYQATLLCSALINKKVLKVCSWLLF